MISFLKSWDVNMVAAIASAIAAISSVIVSCRFFSAQRKQAHISQKISLFEKRFEIYHCFKILYGYANRVIQDTIDIDTSKQQLNYLSMMEEIASDFDFLNGKSYRSEYNLLLQKVDVGGEEGHQADMNLYYLDDDVHRELRGLKERSISTIEKGQFIFKRQLIPVMVTYVNELIDYVDIFQKGTVTEHVRDALILLKAIDEVKKNDVIGKMESELNVQ